MKIYVLGSSLTSCYWNGAATYYRGMYKNLHRLGHEITFAEPDIYNRQQNRDCARIEYAEIRLYETPCDLGAVLSEASRADLIIKRMSLSASRRMTPKKAGNFVSKKRRLNMNAPRWKTWVCGSGAPLAPGAS